MGTALVLNSSDFRAGAEALRCSALHCSNITCMSSTAFPLHTYATRTPVHTSGHALKLELGQALAQLWPDRSLGPMVGEALLGPSRFGNCT